MKWTNTKIGGLVAGLLVVVAVTTNGQQPAASQPQQPGAAPAGRGAAVPSLGPTPEISADNRVTFRLNAPNAHEVLLNGDWPGGRRVAMTKDDTGVWSTTVGPLKPEFWAYTFSVDGVKALDPGNTSTKRDVSNFESYLLIPGPESDLYQMKDVPHGNVSAVWYDAPTLKLKRRMYVYTPPDFLSGTTRYPVLYLLHGGSGDEEQWNTIGRTSQILDNLIAQGKAQPMIVVMPNGNANQKMAQGSGPVPGQSPVLLGGAPAGRGAAAPGAGAPAARGGQGAVAPAPIGGLAISESIVKDIVPFMEKNFRALPGKDNRAIAGLSMGGAQTLTATNNFPGNFAYVGVWSMGVRQPDDVIVKQLQAVKAGGVKLYDVACGVNDTQWIESSKTLDTLLTQVDQKHTFRQTPGGHSWHNWRAYLTDFAPLLFR